MVCWIEKPGAKVRTSAVFKKWSKVISLSLSLCLSSSISFLNAAQAEVKHVLQVRRFETDAPRFFAALRLYAAFRKQHKERLLHSQCAQPAVRARGVVRRLNSAAQNRLVQRRASETAEGYLRFAVLAKGWDRS